MKAVLLDRDGTINYDFGNTYERMDVKLEAHALVGLKALQDAGYKLIIITNQGGVEAGNYTEGQVVEFNHKLLELLSNRGVEIDDIYYCPHDNHTREEKCNCSKPEIGMVLKAVNQHNLDISKCWFVGDKTSDVETGRRSGCRTVLVMTGMGGKDNRFEVKPDYVADNLKDAAEFILNNQNDK